MTATGEPSENLSVAQITEKYKDLIKEGDEIKEKLSILDLQLPQVTQLDQMQPDQVDTKDQQEEDASKSNESQDPV